MFKDWFDCLQFKQFFAASVFVRLDFLTIANLSTDCGTTDCGKICAYLITIGDGLSRQHCRPQIMNYLFFLILLYFTSNHWSRIAHPRKSNFSSVILHRKNDLGGFICSTIFHRVLESSATLGMYEVCKLHFQLVSCTKENSPVLMFVSIQKSISSLC